MNDTRVLLVDDEKEFTDVLSERLRMRKLDVMIANSGEDAVQLASDRAFDAVVLDLAMPGMDGIETLKLLLRQNPNLQVILLSGQGTLETGVEALRSGAMEFMTKPAKIDALVDRIQLARTRTDRLTEQDIESTMSNILQRRGW